MTDDEKVNQIVAPALQEINKRSLTELFLFMRTRNSELTEFQLQEKIRFDEAFEEYFRVRKMAGQKELGERISRIEAEQDSVLRKMSPGLSDEAREERRKVARELQKTQTKLEKVGKMDAKSAKFVMDLALSDDYEEVIETENHKNELKESEALEAARSEAEAKEKREARKLELQKQEREETIEKVKNMTVEQMKNIPLEELVRLKNLVKNL